MAIEVKDILFAFGGRSCANVLCYAVENGHMEFAKRVFARITVDYRTLQMIERIAHGRGFSLETNNASHERPVFR